MKKERKPSFTKSEIETIIQSGLDMIEKYESEISDLEDEINEYEDEMCDNNDDYDLSFLTGDQDLVHCAICAKQGISKPSVGIAKDSLPKCRDCYLL